MEPENRSKPWFVYFIKSLVDNSIYTGITTDVEKRLKTHNAGRGARYTRARKPFVLMMTIKCPNKSEALKMEAKLKKLSHREKELMINEQNGRFVRQ